MLTYKELMERINIAKTKMGDVIKDFQDSDAPQFKGKSKEKRRQMAIAAKLEADRGVKEETDLEEGSYKDGDTRMGSVGPITTDAERAERAKKYREKMMKKESADYLETDLKKRKKNNDKAVEDMKKMGSPMKNPHFGEEAEQIDELSAELATRAGDAADERLRVLRKQRKFGSNPSQRETKSSNQVRKFDSYAAKKQNTNEEAEQIDELSTPTLQSYRKKARAQGNAIVDKMKMGGGDWSKDQKDTKTLRKRAAGANMSGKQLVKRGESLKTEDVEQTDEELKGSQHKLDANKNGKVDSNDFKILRNAKKARYQ